MTLANKGYTPRSVRLLFVIFVWAPHVGSTYTTRYSQKLSSAPAICGDAADDVCVRLTSHENPRWICAPSSFLVYMLVRGHKSYSARGDWVARN